MGFPGTYTGSPRIYSGISSSIVLLISSLGAFLHFVSITLAVTPTILPPSPTFCPSPLNEPCPTRHAHFGCSCPLPPLPHLPPLPPPATFFNSITSLSVNSRNFPACTSKTSGPNCTLLIFSTWCPTRSNILRICRFRPSIKVTSYQGLARSPLATCLPRASRGHSFVPSEAEEPLSFAPSCANRIFAGEVFTRRPSSKAIVMPARSFAIAFSSGFPLTFTQYVFGTCEPAFINFCASAPSFVISSNPSPRHYLLQSFHHFLECGGLPALSEANVPPFFFLHKARLFPRSVPLLARHSKPACRR